MRTTLVCASLLGACVLTLAAGVPAQADTTTVSFNVAPGACSAAIPVPANNKPVFLMASMIGSSHQGVGGVALLRAQASPALLDWAGTDYYAGLERNYAFGAGTHIMYLDYNGKVEVFTANSTHIQVCQAADGYLAHANGYVSFLY